MGCGRMSPALLLLLFLASCSLLQGMLLRPRHVRLEAENFHVRLHWEPDPSSPSNATYEVEWRNRTLNWTKAGACRGNSRGSWVCELYFDRIHDIYWARVRVVAGGQQSEWASSSELQLYRDTIVGPPRLSWLLQDQILSINIITPLTPYKRRTGSYKPVDRVLLKLWYWLQLFEGDLLIQQALQNSELSVPPLQLEENPLALLLQTVLPSHGPSTAGQASTVVPQLLRGLNQDVSGYCDNGFGPDCPEGRDPSCTQRLQLGHALGSQVPSQPEKDGEAGDGDDLPEQLVLVGLTGSSYIGDRDSQIPERWLPLHFQLYSKCQCPVLGAGSHLPLPVPSRSCSQEYLEQSLGTAEHWIRLSSVKLPSSAEEEGEQLPCAPQPLLGGGPGPQQGDSGVSPGCSAQAAPRVPSPCRPLPSPRSFLRAVAFSGYEPRAPSGSEP
ncbi:uncharacterized protein [Sylvia atricapilla]|uniref:uncharacterized protein isoform X4 n=1 Tax=Sylvia atricapilla TaxID=48155 RepID=UPI0033907C30